LDKDGTSGSGNGNGDGDGDGNAPLPGEDWDGVGWDDWEGFVLFVVILFFPAFFIVLASIVNPPIIIEIQRRYLLSY
jgi:hypothetical protein